MFSRCSIPKNVEKYCKSLNSLKGKWTFKRLCNHKLYEKYSPSLLFTSKDVSNTSIKNKNETRIQLNSIKDLFRTSAKPNSLSYLNLKDKILLSAVGVSVAHTDASAVLDPIPEPPVPTAEVLDKVAAVGEQPFESLGLGGWTPVGVVQHCLEYLHVSLDVPWWGAIVIGTIVVRLLMFPLVVIAQRNGARMNNYLPQLQVLQLKMTEARQTGNQLDAARYGQEMMAFMKEKQLNPLKNMIVPLAQMPLFISFFIGLRQMANCPVESMTHGGLWWFTDLTLPDQFFILPVITSLTMWLTIEVGTDTAKLSAQNLQMMKYVLRAMPLVVLPFTVNFPGAILCYWVCTNFISLGQVGVLRIPKVRDFFKIEPLVTHNPDKLPIKNKGFVGGMKESWTNMKITSELEGRKRYDEMQFQRAGKGPVVKTYKFDPTKQNASAYSAKKQ
ncbi:OXA1L mitochondrial inner membrane protein [Carabus blaptoides fortunei]